MTCLNNKMVLQKDIQFTRYTLERFPITLIHACTKLKQGVKCKRLVINETAEANQNYNT